MDDIRVLHTDAEDRGPYEEFEGAPPEVETASTLEDASRKLESKSFDVVVTGAEFEDGDGADLVRQVRRQEPDTGCVLYSDSELARSVTGGSEAFAEFVPADVENSTTRLEQIIRTTAAERSQTAYPLREDERERVRMVESLDVGSEALDRDLEKVLELATEHYDAPMATVSVMERRSQKFVKARGLDVETVPRQETICSYTIARGEVTVVEDVKSHPWSEDMGDVHELGIEFYAGCPVNPSGKGPAGTVCVYDEEPRSFDAGDRSYLSLLAEDAGTKLATHALDAETGGDLD